MTGHKRLAGRGVRTGSMPKGSNKGQHAMQKISIWDEDARRLMESEKTLRQVMSALRIQAEIQLNSEPPLLARHGLSGKTPAVQIGDGDFWTYTGDKSMDAASLRLLLESLQEKQLLR